VDIDINEVVSSVRAVDDQALVSPQVLRRIVQAVVQAVEQKAAHEKRAGDERRITGGVADEQDAEG
jgi:hypothetical protein